MAFGAMVALERRAREGGSWLVRISLANIPDPQMRQRLQSIPTGLTIPDEDVDALVSAGEQLVQQNTKIRWLISDLDSRTAAVAAQARPEAERR